MNSTTISNLLNDINDGLQLGKKITKSTIEAHLVVLVDVHDDYYSRIKVRVIETWKFNSLPKPAHIRDIYESIKTARISRGMIDPQVKAAREKEIREATQRKSRHQADINDFTQRIIRGQQRTSSQQKALDQILLFFEATPFDGKDPAKELAGIENKLMTWNAMTPFQSSLVGLYMDFLEGKLEPLTGNKTGDIRLPSRAAKPYNEQEYAKDKARQRSLNYDKERPGA